MWFFYHFPSGLRDLSRYLELPMVSLSYYSVGGGLVVVFLPVSSFYASLLQVNFVAGTLAFVSFSMSGPSSCSRTILLESKSSASDLGDRSTLTAGASSILPFGQSSKCVLSLKNTTSGFLIIFFVSKKMSRYALVI